MDPAPRIGCGCRWGLWVASLILVLGQMAQAQEWTWTIEAVDSSATFSALAVDEDGNVHVAYMSSDGGGAKYGFRSAATGRWFTMVVDKSSGLVNIALDSQQRPHLCYFPYQTLKYASWDGKRWQTQEIAPRSGERDFSCGIAVGPDGAPHVTWYQLKDADNQHYLHIRYAILKDGAWHAKTLDFSHETGKWNSVRVDSAGRVYVSYSAFREHALRFASSEPPGDWKVTTVEDGTIGHRDETTPGMGNSMVLDKNGRPNFSYRDETTLRYAWPEGDHWRIDVVDQYANPFQSMSWIGQRTALALDGDGKPHIAYETDGSLKHAWWDGKRWRIQPMGIRGPQQRYAALAISNDNQIYISYSDPVDGSLKVLVGKPVQSQLDARQTPKGEGK